MAGSRFFLVLVRLLVAAVGATLAAFKFIKPEATPAFLALPEFGDNGGQTALPWETNPAFAKILLLLFLISSLLVIIMSFVAWYQEKAAYGRPLPVATWPVLAALFIGAGGWFWYSLVALATGSYWGFVFSLGVINSIIFIYEFAGHSEGK
jgi:hypothetical protein